jgi:hypothetical protein
MNIVYLVPHFCPYHYLFCAQLKNMGANVLGIGDASYDSLQPELKSGLTEYYRVDKMTSYDQLLKACGYFTHSYGKLDRIESHVWHSMEIEARLRTDFNIPGMNARHITRFTRRNQTRKCFQNAGMNIPKGKVFKNAETIRDFVRKTGYPIVLKPDRCLDAAKVLRIDNDMEMKTFLAYPPPMKYLMEAFIQGELCSFDGLVDRNGAIVFQTAQVFNHGILEIAANDLDLFYYSLRELPEDLEKAGRQVIRAFDIRERFFHIEFIRTPDQRLFGLSAGDRPRFCLSVDMFNYSNNIDLYREWANIVIRSRFSSAYSRPYHSAYIGRRLNKNYTRAHREIMQAYGYLIVHHAPISPGFSPIMGNYGYIANSPDLSEIQAVSNFIQETA